MITLFIFLFMVSAQYSYIRFLEKNKDDKESKMCTFKKAIKKTWDENLITIIGLFVLEVLAFVCFGYFIVSLKEFIIYLLTKQQ